MNRIIKLTVALVVALSGFLVAGTTPAGAQTSAQTSRQAAHSVAAPVTAPAARALPQRSKVRIKSKQTGRVTFKMWAAVRPAGGKKKVQLLYSRTRDGNYRVIRRDKMNRKGRADFGRVSRLGWYVVLAPATKRYEATYSSNAIRIRRVRG